MNKLNTILMLFILSLISFAPAFSAEQLNVVTSMSTLEEIVNDIGGQWVKVQNIGPHDQELHFVIVRPSHVHMVMNASLNVHTGLMGEPWLAGLLEAASNMNLFPGQVGDCDASLGIKVLEKPEVISREMGDVHPGGNPHFWLDPVNIIAAGVNVKNKLIQLAPKHKEDFENNFKKFAQNWKTRTVEWAKRLKKLEPIKVIDYHVSWSYLFERFNMERIATIEMKPGIKPSGSHLAKVIESGKAHKVDFLIAEPFFPQRDIKMVAKELNIPTLIIQQSPGGELKRQEDVFEAIVSFIEKLKSSGAR
jgi:zinc/manganese transport system substrate-binding protein